MSTPKLGRNARLFKDGTVIGYAKDISVKASADLIKEYSMDSLSTAIVAPGKQAFNAGYFNLKQKSLLSGNLPCFFPDYVLLTAYFTGRILSTRKVVVVH